MIEKNCIFNNYHNLILDSLKYKLTSNLVDNNKMKKELYA